MLDHKWEGVQTVAARVLGEWGGPKSVAGLRAWLSRLHERPYAWAARGVAAKALAMCVSETDIPGSSICTSVVQPWCFNTRCCRC
jgi:hypothetical protein